MSVLEVRDLTVRYDAHVALAALTLDVAGGEKLALLGHNGAGKSTLFKTVLGFLFPASGSLTVAGARPGSAEARAATSYLPETVAFHRALTGLEILTHFARLRGEKPSIAMPLLEKVGIAHAAKRPLGTWSKGMRQRLGLAQALIGKPRLMLLDEPTSGLDPVSRRDFYAIVDEVAGQGTAVLLSSHGLEEVENRTDRIAILSQGRLVAEGTLAALAEEAALDAQIRVTAAPGQADALRARFGGARVNGAALDLSSPVAAKFSLMRALSADGDVRDIDVRMPSLDDVYRHYSDLGGQQ
jgi:Cu-processing system ATP-binding protein